MAITVSYDVTCDMCGNWVYGFVARLHVRIPAKRAREKSHEAGWERRLVNGRYMDLCPNCLERMKEKGVIKNVH